MSRDLRTSALAKPLRRDRKRPMPSYDEGTKLVPQDEVAQLHEGEAVIPADQNPNNPDAKHPLGKVELEDDGKSAPLGVAAPVDPSKMRELGSNVPISTPAPKYTGPNAGREKAPAPGVAISDAALPQDEYRYAKDQIRQRKIDAADKGDLVGLGSAKVAESELEKANPYGSAGNHPGMLGKIEHGLATAGNIAGNAIAPGVMPEIPGSAANIAAREQSGLGLIKTGEENAEREAQIKNLNSEADARQNPKPQLLTGDENVRTNPATGERERAWRITPTSPITWVPEGQVPSVTPQQSPLGSAVAPQSPLGTISSAPAASAPAAPNFVYGKATPENMPANASQLAKQATAEFVDAQGKPLLTPGQIDAEVKALGPTPTQKMLSDAYNKLQGLAQERAREDEAEKLRHEMGAGADARAEKAQDRKDQRTMGYAMNKDGQLEYMSKYDADQIHSTFEQQSPSDVNKDRQYLRQLDDVQTNVSKYRNAVNAQKGNIEHTGEIRRIVAGKNADDLARAAWVGGGALMDEMQQYEMTHAWNKLTTEERNIVIGYLRSRGSIIAYNKAISGSGRANKEQLEVEMMNLPSPDVGATVANPQLDSFQENINVASQGFPGNLPGMKTPATVRREIEGASDRHVIDYQGHQYEYKGSGATDDIKNYTRIQ